MFLLFAATAVATAAAAAIVWNNEPNLDRIFTFVLFRRLSISLTTCVCVAVFVSEASL